jgi:hypothetical protein
VLELEPGMFGHWCPLGLLPEVVLVDVVVVVPWLVACRTVPLA